VKGGASAIVSQKEVECSVPVITVKNSRQTLAKAAAAYYGHATQNFYLCGITGTNGKTTLTYLLEKLWTPEKSGVMGTINIRFKNKILPTSLTTPDAITVQKIFSQMAKSHVEFVAIEASSHALEQSRVSECEFDAAVFTNLSQDHLDYHGDMES